MRGYPHWRKRVPSSYYGPTKRRLIVNLEYYYIPPDEAKVYDKYPLTGFGSPIYITRDLDSGAWMHSAVTYPEATGLLPANFMRRLPVGARIQDHLDKGLLTCFRMMITHSGPIAESAKPSSRCRQCGCKVESQDAKCWYCQTNEPANTALGRY